MKYFTYHIATFGCQMNISDSERIAGQLEGLGYRHVPNETKADIIIYNTCCVRESAETRIYGRLGKVKRLKASKPDLLVIVAGCLAQKDQSVLLKKAPHVDLVLGTQNIDRLSDIIKGMSERFRERIVSGRCETDGLGELSSISRLNTVSAWIPVMYGCDNYCSYCIVPHVRGRERSRPPEIILDEVRNFAREGGKEITLLGQNVNSYGRNDSSGWDFPRLLSAINQIDEIQRVRFMTSHPKDLSERLIEVMSAGGNICEHIHLPVQSGSDEVLANMNRKYSTAEYRILVENIRRAIPSISITTDFIVGFPGETEKMFEETLTFVKEIQFDAAFTFLYSQRSGTPAAALDQQVSAGEKNLRLRQLMDLQNSISLKKNEPWAGQTVEVLVDGPSKSNPDIMSGRTRCNRLVLWSPTNGDIPGALRCLKITSAQTFLLRGEPMPDGAKMQ